MLKIKERGWFVMKKIFTLLEILVTVFIVVIFSGFAIVGYRQVLDNARQRVDEVNLNVLNTAVETQVIEEGALPASLGELKPIYIERAYAQVIKRNNFKTKLAYFLVKINTPAYVYASPSYLEYNNLKKYGVTPEVFRCPADTNGPPSYAINSSLAGKRWDQINDNAIIIGESDNYTENFTSPENIVKRHIRNFGMKRIGLGVKKKNNQLIDVDQYGNTRERRRPGKGHSGDESGTGHSGH